MVWFLINLVAECSENGIRIDLPWYQKQLKRTEFRRRTDGMSKLLIFIFSKQALRILEFELLQTFEMPFQNSFHKIPIPALISPMFGNCGLSFCKN